MASHSRPVLPRTALLLILALLGVSLCATVAVSATPAEGTIDQSRTEPLPWSGEITGRALETACGPENSDSLPQCDVFTLTVDIDPIFWGNFDGGLEVGAANRDKGDMDDDLNILVYDKDGVKVSTASAAGPGQSEKVAVKAPSRAGSPYRVVVYETGATAGPDLSTLTYDAGARIDARAKAPADGAAGLDKPIPTEPVSDAKCVDGVAAGVFPCKGVDLAGFLPLDEIGGGNPATEGSLLNDIWGWTDPTTNREYALVGKRNGTAFVDVTEPTRPKYLGQLPTFAGAESPAFNVWRDVKVYENKAYIVSEEPGHGMQVFDLTRLRGLSAPPATPFTEDFHYAGFGNAHNIAINEKTGFAYVIGTNTCSGGSHVVDLKTLTATTVPAVPPVCVSGDGYTHDNQCVVYDGPDAVHRGKEICFDFNEDSVTIQDVTDKAKPVMLSRTTYGGSQYTHQGWLTEDQRHLLFNDELDEQGNSVNTTTRILNVENLDAPSLVGDGFVHSTKAIDHNNYIKGNRAYQSNYRSGLRILDISGVATGDLKTDSFFDVYPADDDGEFNGTWSNYPYFKSGTIVATGIEQGLFVLREQSPERAVAQPPAEQPTATQPATTQPATTQPAGTSPSTTQPATTSPSTKASSGAAIKAVTPRVRLTRTVRSGRRLTVRCSVTGARQRSCVVRIQARVRAKLRTVKTLRFGSRTASRTVRLTTSRTLVLRADAVTTTGRKLSVSRTLKLTARRR